MAVATFTRRQIVADMLPEFLTKRSQPFSSRAEAYAKDLGISRLALMHLSNGWALADGDTVPRGRYRWRSPYSTERSQNESLLDQYWGELVGAGLAEPTPEGWRLPTHALRIVDEVQRRSRAYLRELPLPAKALARAAAQLERLAERIPATAERARLLKRLPPPPPNEPRSDTVTLNRAVTELWSFRDDCHVGAWRTAGYEGPTVDVLTQVWSSPPDIRWATVGGSTSLEDIVKSLATKQERADVERHVEQLVKRGDAAREGATVRITSQGKQRRDAIEDETDRRYFAIWDLDDAATARLGEDFRAVIDAIPKAT